MGIGETAGPQKKKMKQAQLPFCFPSEKVGNKRKLNDESIDDSGHAVKLIRKDSITSEKTCNKENVKVNAGDSSIVECLDLCSEDEIVSTSEIPVLEEPMEVSEKSDDLNDENEKDACSKLSEVGGSDRQIEESPTNSIITKSDKVDCKEQLCKEAELDEMSHKLPECTTSEALSSPCKGNQPKKEISGEIQKQDESSAKVKTELVNQSVDDIDKSSLDLSVESNQCDLNESLVVSSEEELSVKKSPGTNNRKSIKAAERLKRNEEKKRMMLEKEELKLRKKAEREKKKSEEMRLKEEDRKRREDDRKRKEDDRKRKEDDRKRKEDEKKKKEEAKEEEKRKKEDEKRRKEEVKEEDRKRKEEARLAEERKENLAKLAFTKFFIQNKSKTSLPKKEENVAVDDSEMCNFMPFPIKNDMRLAPQTRRVLLQSEKSIVDNSLARETRAKLYLDEIKIGGRVPLTSAATWALSEEQHDVIIVESLNNDKMDEDEEVTSKVKTNHQRAKLLQFHDNRRPPYWGTWRKMSQSVTSRRPFGQDKVLDYEVDSDSEWEDEDEGEDIDKELESDKEQSDDENVGENGYLLDKTFVPHGYLSDEEAPEEEDLNPEDMKLKMKVLKQEFEQDIKTKAQHIKPRLLGCVWISNDTTEVSKGSLYETLLNFRCRWAEEDGPINPFEVPPVDPTLLSPANSRFPSSLIERLVKVVHGSKSSHPNLVTDFMATLENDKNMSTISKRSVKRKIKEIAAKAPDANGRLVWKVNIELCTEFNLEPIPDSKSVQNSPTPIAVLPPSNKAKGTPLTSYLKKASKTPNDPITPVAKKRLIPICLSSSPKPTHPIVSQNRNPVMATSTISPVRKRIQPITLSKTVTINNPKSEESTSNAIKSFFGAPKNKAITSNSSDVISIDDSD